MAEAVDAALPADAAILVAAVADWRVEASPIEAQEGRRPAAARSSRANPDILATLGAHPDRPRLLVGFAAETDDVVANATAKRTAKKADWIVANDVSGDVMGGARNRVHLVTDERRRGLARGSPRKMSPATSIAPHCRGARLTVRIRITRLPHGEGLPLPSYATPGAAGMDVVAAEDLDLAARPAPRRRHRFPRRHPRRL